MITHVENRRMFTPVILGILLAILALSAVPLGAQSATLRGAVLDVSGNPVQGALVRIRSEEAGLTVMVVSQARGRYSTPGLVPGTYSVEGIGGDFQSEAVHANVIEGNPTTADIRLSVARAEASVRKRMSQAEHAATMPDGPGKELVLTKCVLCHSLDGAVDTRTLRIKDSREEWEEKLGVHKYYMEDLPEALSDREVNLIVDYMTMNFTRGAARSRPREEATAPDPNRHLPRSLLTGPEAQYFIMTFDLPRRSGPHDISIDSQGIAWTMDRGAGLIGSFDPEALRYTSFPIPPGKVPSRPGGSAVGPNGTVWNVDNGQNSRLVAYDPQTGQFKTYPMPAPPRQQEFDGGGLSDGPANMNTITFQDGFVWGSGLKAGQIYKLDPVSGGVITYPVPKGQPPYGLAFDNNGMLWYGAQFADEIVRLDPATAKRTHYRVPTPKADLRHIQTDAHGNVWASAQQSDKLIKVDARTGQVTEYDPPTPLSGINSVDVDRERDLVWVAEAEADRIARFDPRTNTFTEFALPDLATGLKRIAVDPTRPNRVWWSANSSDRIGYIEVFE